MKVKSTVLSLLLLGAVIAVPAVLQAAPVPQGGHVTGQYLEARTADVYTGPCFANAEVNLAGQEAILAWRIDRGTWGDVSLDGLSVVAVVRAKATLGDPYSNPLPAKAVMILDAQANPAQRAALLNFAQTQAGALGRNVVAVEVSPIRFAVHASRHGYASLEASNLARITTRAITSADDICHNEEVFYQPLAANLNHAMPAMVTDGGYRGNHLGVTWSESGRRGAFVGTFSF